MEIADRLKEERARLGLTQAQMAEASGNARGSVINWETGRVEPSAQGLRGYAAAGVDVLYVLTGQRSQPVAPQELLPAPDRILLDNFHAAPAGVQAGVRQTLGAFSPERPLKGGGGKKGGKGRAA